MTPALIFHIVLFSGSLPLLPHFLTYDLHSHCNLNFLRRRGSGVGWRLHWGCVPGRLQLCHFSMFASSKFFLGVFWIKLNIFMRVNMFMCPQVCLYLSAVTDMWSTTPYMCIRLCLSKVPSQCPWAGQCRSGRASEEPRLCWLWFYWVMDHREHKNTLGPSDCCGI